MDHTNDMELLYTVHSTMGDILNTAIHEIPGMVHICHQRLPGVDDGTYIKTKIITSDNGNNILIALLMTSNIVDRDHEQIIGNKGVEWIRSLFSESLPREMTQVLGEEEDLNPYPISRPVHLLMDRLGNKWV